MQKDAPEIFGRLKSGWIRFRSGPYFWPGLLVVLVLVLHFSVILQPGEYVFDEKWYAGDAAFLLEGKGTTLNQHPPLGRLIIAGGISLFGDNAFGWRIFPVLFGAAGLVLMYLVCRRLKLPENVCLLATFLLAVENLSFVQSSIAMLDVFSLTFMLAAFLSYLHGRPVQTGFWVGVSALAKFTGVLAIPVIGLHWLITNRRGWLRWGLGIAAAVATFLLLRMFCDWMIWGKLLNPVTETVTMLEINSWSTFAEITSTMLSRPWEWVFNYEIITYWVEPHYMAMISPTVWALTVPSVSYMLYRTFKGSRAAAFSLAWFVGTYMLWIPINLITDRTSYIFYFYPTIGAVCLAVSMSLKDLTAYFSRQKTRLSAIFSRWLVPLLVFLHLVVFVYLAPVPYIWKLAGGALLYIWARFALGTERRYKITSEFE